MYDLNVKSFPGPRMIALQNEKPMQQETQTARQREQASLMFTSHWGHKQTAPCEMTSSFMEGSILKPVVGQRIIIFWGGKYDIWLLFQPLWC
jgi:hypothetical protein